MYTFGGGGRGFQKVYGLYTHENVDIYGRPLKQLHLPHSQLNASVVQEVSDLLDLDHTRSLKR